ncbi:hypothetical protein AAFF_G00133920 [Aldrovandia affinis]|uniref:Uncharacterized protein n=1 Tax=Aldrovandia affinis TaxID=143900 RepID=A0AAD7RQ27_9TELE|nr:hypothetical protein AAFF_G00133920 [Aldrovandia affinis]
MLYQLQTGSKDGVYSSRKALQFNRSLASCHQRQQRDARGEEGPDWIELPNPRPDALRQQKMSAGLGQVHLPAVFKSQERTWQLDAEASLQRKLERGEQELTRPPSDTDAERSLRPRGSPKDGTL